MQSLQEIETAIQALSSVDQEALVRDLPHLLPELKGELAWRRILNDPTPSPSLSRLVDRIDSELSQNPEAFSEITDSDFQKHQ